MAPQKITPYLWYDHQALEAAEFYCSLFENGKVTSKSRMIVTFELAGLSFMALNGGPQFTFNEAISLMIHCDDQAEVDHFWNGLTTDGGEESRCGWLKDRYGLSWQVVPTRFMEMMSTGDPEQGKRVMDALLQMSKIELPILEEAFAKS